MRAPVFVFGTTIKIIATLCSTLNTCATTTYLPHTQRVLSIEMLLPRHHCIVFGRLMALDRAANPRSSKRLANGCQDEERRDHHQQRSDSEECLR
eukprot:SAG11_NODE_3144_length_2653_cov_6.857478_3_plen_95_part_00